MYNNQPQGYRPYNHSVPPYSSKGIGFAGFLVFAVSTALILVMFLMTKTIIPCSVPGGGEEYGWYGCNNSAGNSFMFVFALTFGIYVFLVLPVAGILALIGTVKNAGRKWGIWTLISIGVSVMIGPILIVLINGSYTLM